MNITFSPPDITDKEIDSVVEVLKSGWITTGAKAKEFEREIANYVNCSDVLAMSSQTACGQTALNALGIGPGDEVITTAYTYTASASVIHHVGAKIVLVDTLPDSFEIDYDAVENAITTSTKAIIPVDIAGIPCDYDRLLKIAESKKDIFTPNTPLQESLGRIAIIEDASHALGATYKGKKVGSFSDFTTFSFHAVKNLTTAEGGAVCVNDIGDRTSAIIRHGMALYSLHGQSKTAMEKNSIGNWEYDISTLGHKFNMTDIAAAIGLSQLERYPNLLARRKEIVKKYDAAFEGTAIKHAQHFGDDYTSSYHLYLTNVEGIDITTRNHIIIDLACEGIITNVHYKPLPMMTAYKKLGFSIADFPNSYNHYFNEITLPLHTLLTDDEVDYITDTYKKIVNKYI